MGDDETIGVGPLTYVAIGRRRKRHHLFSCSDKSRGYVLSFIATHPCSFSEFHVSLFSLFHHQQGSSDYRRKANQWGEVPETCDDPCELFNRELTQNQLVTEESGDLPWCIDTKSKLSSSHPIILYTSWSAGTRPTHGTGVFKRSPPPNLPVPRTNQSN